MTLTTHKDIIQGTDQWFNQRRGIVTASAVGRLITTRKLGALEYSCPECGSLAGIPCLGKRTGEPMKTLHPDRGEYARQRDVTVFEPSKGDYARDLTLLLAAERITGWTDPTYTSDDMWMGIECEPLARAAYAQHYAPVTEAGFMVEDKWGWKLGFSPDGLVGDDGLIEIKSRRSKNQLATILADEVPQENMAQLQCGLLVSGREWIDYVSYTGGMPLYVKRVEPNQKWFDAITEAVAAFEEIVGVMVRAYEQLSAELHLTERATELEIVI